MMSGPFTLGDEETAPDPLEQFRLWLDAARRIMAVGADTMVLATATAAGRPSARAVLLRGLDEGGLVFFTDTRSRKAAELAANPWGALVLVWTPQERQVRAEGPVGAVPVAEADAYFATRPRGHRLATWMSHQSQPVADRAELETAMARLDAEHGEDVPRPPWWGGYRLAPAEWEFWQGRENRVHDRVRYRRAGPGGWERTRLAP
jgi:pyridoxamine 5'-phosphate oxidase